MGARIKQMSTPMSLKPLLLSPVEDDMARRLGTQKGYVYRKGPSWFVEFREYAVGPDGERVAIPRCEWIGHADVLSKREAVRKAAEDYLDAINRRNLKPSSSMLVRDFLETKFQLGVVEKKKPAGRKHYRYLLDKFIAPNLGQRRLCDVQVGDVEAVVAAVARAGYSWQTRLHVRNAISAVFRHAKRHKLYLDENPAAGVEVGAKPTVRRRPGYSWEQAAMVLARLRSPYRDMAALAIATSMNVAEMCGIRLKWCNFTDRVIVVEGEVLAPYSIGVRENYYESQWGTLKAGTRRRNVPLTPDLAAALTDLVRRRGKFQAPDDPLFASRNGTPVDQHNVSNRHFKPLTKKLGFPVTWHGFRRAHSTFAGQLEGIALEDRIAGMGHSDAAMTLHYSIEDVERRRRVPAEIMAKIGAVVVPPLEEMEAKGGVQ